MDSITLTLDLKSFWHVGTGKGSGFHLDALVEKDAHRLPFVPGRMLKGLLRDALNRRVSWGHFDKDHADPASIITTLFGSSGFSHDGVPRHETQAGCLRFSDACLPSDVHRWLAQPECESLCRRLYHDLYSTAIDAKRGVAKKHSLRAIQATIPLQLVAEISQTKPTRYHDWPEILQTSLPLIRAVGAYRSRGLGRVTMSRDMSKNREKAIKQENDNAKL